MSLLKSRSRSHASHAPHIPHAPHLARAITLLSVSGLAAPALAQNWYWATSNGVWSNPLNWNELSPPPEHANVFIGNLPVAQNTMAMLENSVEIANLTVLNGMTVYNNHRTLLVNGTTFLSGSNSAPGPGDSPLIYPSGMVIDGVDGNSFITHDLTVAAGARFELMGQAYAHASGLVTIGGGSRLAGRGVLTTTGLGNTLINNGLIRAAGEGGLTIRNFNGGLFDLDGSTNNGEIVVSGFGTRMRFIGAGLTDSFSGTIRIDRGAELDMQLASPWTADANSRIEIVNQDSGYDTVDIRGAGFTFGGELDVGYALAIGSETITLQPSARVRVAEWTPMSVGYVGTSMTTVEGGSYEMEPASTIAFYSPTTFRGGEFHGTPSPASGVLPNVRMYEATVWDGTVDFNARVEHFGTASVVGPTVINAAEIDISSSNWNPLEQVWSVGHSLVINTEAFAPYEEGRFDGTMNIAGGVWARLAINLATPGDAWTMDGQMNLSGVGLLPVARLAGSNVIVTGGMHVMGGTSQVSANASFRGATLTIDADSRLRLRGKSAIDAATAFVGSGTLENGLGGTLLLDDGVAMIHAGLVNAGVLAIGAGTPGGASVARFTSTEDASWLVDIGGYMPGSGHDILLVTNGIATLGGELHVAMTKSGPGSFSPSVGDEFIILASALGVSGTFSNAPVTTFGALTYEWSVLYGEHTVTLRLDNIVPAPGTTALVALGGVVACRRRRMARA